VKRTLGLATGLVLAWLCASAEQPPKRSGALSPFHLNVYLQNPLAAPQPILGKAVSVATSIFAGIGVSTTWHTGKEREASGESEEVIQIQLDSEAPPQLRAGALAYATPYRSRGARIHVFCDRVINLESVSHAGPYLGHVFAHEIAHVLEGITRHSGEGIMKAQWNVYDLYRMVFRPLSFAADDVDLIHRGLQIRAQSPQKRDKQSPPEQ